MRLVPFILIWLLALALALAVSCGDDDDDDNDDNDSTGDDDTANTDEEPCLTAAKQEALDFCPTVGAEADLTRIGLGAVGLECQYYCGTEYYLHFTECLGGTCICCQ